MTTTRDDSTGRAIAAETARCAGSDMARDEDGEPLWSGSRLVWVDCQSSDLVTVADDLGPLGTWCVDHVGAVVRIHLESAVRRDASTTITVHRSGVDEWLLAAGEN